MSRRFRNQKYSSLKADCTKKGILFEDPEFPASNKSIFFSQVDKDIEWKRPKEICKAPKLIVEGVSCDDIREGELGNCWFVTACTTLAQEPKLLQKVLPGAKDQEWDEKNVYAGIFHFQFWRFGEWLEVVVDDRLPTKDGKLIFCQSKSRNEFWSALLEKAYAKLYGDYESLRTGRVADAMVDFTGGVPQSLCLDKHDFADENEKTNLFSKLCAAKDSSAMVTCHIQGPANMIGQPTSHGLINGHGYVVTAAKSIKVAKAMQGAVGASELNMVRLHNPWGTDVWTGAWSSGSKEWNSMNPNERDKLGLRFQQEAEFWMSFSDFISNFTNVDICHFVNTSFFSMKKTYSEALLHGRWAQNGRNGGSEKHSATFLSNPQYVFDVTSPTDHVMVCLEQNDIRQDRQFEVELLEIGFNIMKVEENRRYRVHIPGDKIVTSEYSKSRSVFQMVTMERGRYVLIPTTDKPGQNGEFLLRLFTGASAGAKELTLECPASNCCSKPHAMATFLNVRKAEGIKNPQEKGTLDPRVIIRCEGEKLKSTPDKHTQNPEWNFKCIFYRKKPELPISVEIWNHNAVVDDFIGEACVDDHGTEDGVEKTYKLFGRKKEKDVQQDGQLFVEVKSSHDLTYL
ncbi:calpain-5-like [Liolophura sinensis]|uniref:calpain-5-like n=1 Tax=Liolophura sinensis TaxID=3198878 RepID=UPI003158D616